MYIVGREDRSSAAFGGEKRKTLGSLMTGIDTSYPVVLMDHQPFRLDEAAGKGIDIQLSGHTHHGQLFPVNLITRREYDFSWGHLEKDGAHLFVTSGVQAWGPPVRTVGASEIMVIRISLRDGT
jgi:hypothetical protein